MSNASSLEQHPLAEQHTAFSQASIHITQHGQMQFHGYRQLNYRTTISSNCLEMRAAEMYVALLSH